MDTFNQQLFVVLDLAVLERGAGGAFDALGSLPEWFRKLYPEFKAGKTMALDRRLPFLAHFFSDAQELWKSGKKGRLKSGQWSETDSNGQMYQIEATAVNVEKQQILVLETGNYSKQEKEFLFKSHGTLAFDTKMLEAFEYQEAQIRAHAREQLETELQALRDENEELKVRLTSLEKK